ncbi:MAG: MFS transporter [Acidimicrobiia bacterium]
MPRRDDRRSGTRPGAIPGRLVGSALGLATVGVLPVFLAGALAVQLSAEFGYGPRGIGLSIAGFHIASTLSSIALGRLADRIGWQRSVRIGGLGCVLCLAALGGLARSLPTVLLLLGLAGLANALVQPSVNLLLARESPPHQRGLIFGLKQSAIPLATLIGGISVPVVALTIGWRWVFALAAAIGAFVLLWLPPADELRSHPRSETSARAPIPVGSLAPLVVLALLGQTGASVLGSFVVASAVQIGMTEGNAGILLAAASVIGIASRVALGRAADRGLRLDLVPIASLLLVGSAGLALVAIQDEWAAIVGTTVAFAAGWGWPGLFNLLVVDRFAQAPATATSATQTGVYVGNGAGPLVFGVIAAVSFPAAWLMSALLLLLAGSVAIGAHVLDRNRARAV